MQEGSKLPGDPSELRTAPDLDHPVTGERGRHRAASGSDVPGLGRDAVDRAGALDGNVRGVSATDAQVVHPGLAAVVVDLDGDAQLGANDRPRPRLDRLQAH